MVREHPPVVGVHPHALVNRGWARFATGDVQSLVQDSRQALELAPQDNHGRMNL